MFITSWGRLALIMLTWGYSTLLPAETISGRVVSVADGDTITILEPGHRQTKIRLHQIDAPEKKQDFGQRSKQSLSDLVYGKLVKVDVADIDKYGRTVGKVWVNGLDANLEQVKRGMAWVYEKYASDPAYFSAERTAKSASIGLWNQPSPTPPWIFRHPERAGSSITAKPPAPSNNSTRRCGEKRFCKEMWDCAEARFYLNKCGVKTLDGDGDGRPCESLCR